MGTAKRDALWLGGDDPPSKAAILECALGLFARDGLCETSIRGIAEASGYTNPALYKFFPSKEALAVHLFERCYLHITEELSRAVRGSAPFERKIEALLVAFVGMLDKHLDALIYANDNLRSFWRKLPPASRRRSVLGVLRGLLEEGQRQGALRRDLDLSVAIAMVVGTFAQIARMAYFDELEKPYAKLVPSLHRMLRGALC